MNNNKEFEKVSFDVISAIDSIEYDEKKDKLYKAEIIFFLCKALESNKKFDSIIDVLNNNDGCNEDKKSARNKNFEKVSCDIIGAIDSISYESSEEKFCQTKIIYNVGKILKSKDNFDKVIDILRTHEYHNKYKRQALINKIGQ